MASPATTAMERGMKNGMVTTSPASAVNTALCEARSINAGPLPAAGPPDRSTANASRTGTAARPASNVRTRARPKTVRASTSHIETLARQRHKGVLQRPLFLDEHAHADPGLDQVAAAVLGVQPVEGAEDHTCLPGDVRHPQGGEDLAGPGRVVRLDPQLRGGAGAELFEPPLHQQFAAV